MRALAVVLFAVGWIPVFVYRSEPLTARLAVARARERWWIRFTVAAVSLHACATELVLTLMPEAERAAGRIAAGMLVFLGALAWWTWARRSLVALDRRIDPSVPPAALVVEGPFRFVRHPLAFGMLLAALGPAIAAHRAPTWITFALVALGLARRCLQDEEGLRATFGAAYDRYAARTQRLVPFVW